MKKRSYSHKGIWMILGILFVFMLVLNFLTPYVADDFVYMLSFNTKERMTSLSQLIPSMYVHSLRMNGRVISHSLEQIFMLMPKAAFNLCNAAMFTILIYLMYRIANFGRKTNIGILAAIAMGFWCAMPAFGQIALWQVGSLNYLWALSGCLIFILPYLVYYLRGKEILEGKPRLIAFCAGSLLFGMYSEMTSFVGIYLASAILLFSIFRKKRNRKTNLWIPLASACVGYVIMLSLPAEVSAKVSDGLNLSILWANFIRATGKLALNCTPLLALWAASFAAGIVRKTNRDRLILSVLMLTGALGANYMTMIAPYYADRSMSTTVMLLILSVGILLAPYAGQRVVRCGFGILVLVFAVLVTVGTSDIVSCHQQFAAREAVIAEAKAAGETDLVLDVVEPSTRFSAFWDLRDLSTEDPETWPNSSMVKYYGVERILGK